MLLVPSLEKYIYKMDVNASEVLKFLHLVHTLKHVPRRGWVIRDVKNPESIAGHMYAMSIMTFLLGNDSTIDRLKCMQLALVHDLAESIVGDITPEDNVPVDIKHNMEDKAMQQLATYVGDEVGSQIYNLYKEYEAKETAEAKFVKELDRFDFIFTAAFYEKRDNTPGRFEDFFNKTVGTFEHPYIKSLSQELLKQRQQTNSSTD